jgi:hypothetical protein
LTSIAGISILPGDIFGIVALVLIAFTSIFMLVRKSLLRHTKNLDLLRRIHIYAATLGGLFLVLHVAYFISWPLNSAIVLGYIGAALAGVVWLTGTAFLERFRDSLFFHGSLSIGAVGLMAIHAASAGINLPIAFAYGVLALTSIAVLYKGLQHASKTLKAAGLVGHSV